MNRIVRVLLFPIGLFTFIIGFPLYVLGDRPKKKERNHESHITMSPGSRRVAEEPDSIKPDSMRRTEQ